MFHGGIVVDGLEWSYGYCESGSGVYACKPKLNPMYVFRESVDLGTCLKTKQEVREILKAMKAAWPGTDYEVLTKNCNHFCEAFAAALGSKPTPPWLNRMAHGADSTYTAYTSAKQTALSVYRYFWPSDQVETGIEAQDATSSQQQDSSGAFKSTGPRTFIDRSSAPVGSSDTSGLRTHSEINFGRDSHESMFARRGLMTQPSETPPALAASGSAQSLFARQAILPTDQAKDKEGSSWVLTAAAAAAATASRAAEELKKNSSIADTLPQSTAPSLPLNSQDRTEKHILDM